MANYSYKNYKIVDEDQLNADLTCVADAIREKGGTSDTLNFPDGFVSAVEAIEAGGSVSVSKKDVNFYDYDGTLLHSYTVAEAQALSELPTLPEREGLICQGWNWTLEDIKAHNREVDVGATYITDDGTTRLYIHLEEGRTSPMLGVCPNGTVTVDWGDGTAPDTLTGTRTTSVKFTPNHEYAEPGDYIIKLTVNGTMGLTGSSTSNSYSCILRHDASFSNINMVYQNSVKKVEFGDGVTSIGDYAFYYCYSLASIVIPNGVTSIGGSAFRDCYSLASIVIPNGVTSIGGNAFYYCYSLASIVIPNGVTSIGGSIFSDCNSLTSIVIPNSVTSIGDYAFFKCYSLASIVIPNGVTSIGGSAFRECKSLASIVIPNGVTSIGTYTFYGCYSLASIVIPNGVTSIGGNAFYYCNSLASIVIPSGVTSIGGSAFYYCYSLASIVIPSGVTSIGGSAFYHCGGVKSYDFTKCIAVPTLSNTDAFSNIAGDCEIRVPAALYDEWIAATNWATYASKIVAV